MITSHLGMFFALLVTAAAAYVPGAFSYRVFVLTSVKSRPAPSRE
jgi:hypothetical protein